MMRVFGKVQEKYRQGNEEKGKQSRQHCPPSSPIREGKAHCGTRDEEGRWGKRVF